MVNQILKKYGFMILAVIQLQACNKTTKSFGNSNNPELQNQAETFSNAITKYKMDKTGGGDFGYEIQDKGDVYVVQLNHQNFKTYLANDRTFSIAKFIKCSEHCTGARVAGELDILNLMEGRCNFVRAKQAAAEDQMLTGAWMSESIIFGNTTTEIRTSLKENCEPSVNFYEIGIYIQQQFTN